MTKYVAWTDHRAKFNEDDRVISLKAQNLLDAIKETGNLCEKDKNLYRVCLYERVAKNEYRQIMRSNDGMSFHPENTSDYLVRSTYKVNGKTIESFEIHF